MVDSELENSVSDGVRMHVTGWEACALPADHPLRWEFALRIYETAPGGWRVTHGERSLSRDGRWLLTAEEVRTGLDEFVAMTTFTQKEALAAAREYAPHVTAANRTVAEALAEPHGPCPSFVDSHPLLETECTANGTRRHDCKHTYRHTAHLCLCGKTWEWRP